MKIRAFEDNDWDSFVEFSNEYFGQSQLTDRVFNEHWFYDGVSKNWAIQVLEDDNGCIAGIQMEIIEPIKFGDHTMSVCWMANTAVTDEAQLRGAGALLLLWAYKTFPLLAVTSSNDLSTPLQDKLGITVPELSMRRFIYILDPKTAELCSSSDRSKILDVHFQRSSVSNCTFNLVDQIPEDYELLWKGFRNKVFCTTERDTNYMRWRYLKSPYVDYKIVEVRSQGVLKGLATVRFEKTPQGHACRVLDFVSEDEWAVETWNSLIDLAGKEESLFIDFMVIGSIQDKYLLKAGFKLVDDEAPLALVPHLLSPVEDRRWTNTFHMGGRLANLEKRWRSHKAVYFTKGDADRDWPTQYYMKNIRV